MTERELWLKCVNHCIKNDIIGFHLMFDVFLEMREREGYKLVPVEPTKEMLLQIETPSEFKFEIPCEYQNVGIDADTARDIYKAMIGAVE